MMPTSISQIIEQVFNAAVSLLAAWGFINAFSDGTENSIAKWGAAGSTVGTGAGVVTALGIHASGIWCEPQKNPAPGREGPQTSGRVLQRDFFVVIILVVSPIILSAFVYNVNAYINGCIFNHTYWLLSFKTVTFRDEQKEFMRDHYVEIRRKCLTAGWKSLKGNFRLTRAIRLLMVFLIPHHLIK